MLAAIKQQELVEANPLTTTNLNSDAYGFSVLRVELAIGTPYTKIMKAKVKIKVVYKLIDIGSNLDPLKMFRRIVIQYGSTV